MMLLQLEQQYLRSNLAQAKTFLAEAELDDDPIGMHQFAQLVNDLTGKLEAMPSAIAQAPAGVALFFGGRPVVGSQGIHADFSGRALDGFQKIVSQRYAAEELGPLANRGPLPLKSDTHLLITDVVRGSFGFVLQAAQDEQSEGEKTSLKNILDSVASTLSRVAAHDGTLFEEAVGEIDERQKNSLVEFLKLLDVEGATIRIVEGERDFELDQAALQRARSRVEGLQISDSTEEFCGQIIGWTDFSAKFEIKLHNSLDVIQGTISRKELERVEREALVLYHQHVRASIKVRVVQAKNRQPKRTHSLMSLELISAPVTWPVAPIQSVVA